MSDFTLSPPPILAAILCNAPPSSFSAPPAPDNYCTVPKQRKYKPWNVYSPEQNGVFCDCFANFKLAKTLMSKLKCSAFIRNTSFTEKLKTDKRRLKNWVFVSSVRVRVPSWYWATYCSPRAICIQGCSQVTQAPRLCHLSYIVYTM